MRRSLIIVGLICLLGFAFVGCKGKAAEEGQRSVTEGKVGVISAQDVQDGVAKYLPTQSKCPVCGKPINAAFYKDVQKGRLYFDSNECAYEFMEDPDKYTANIK